MNEDQIITLVRHAATETSHLLGTAPDALKWRRTPALCGAMPPDALGWQEHHSARLSHLCRVCLHAALIQTAPEIGAPDA